MTKIWFFIITFLLLDCGTTLAGPFEDGIAANNRGEYAAAFKMFQTLAQQGDADAQYNLGVLYSKGRGVAQNDAEAVRWYRLAAAQGNWNGQTNLGTMYAYGKGVRQDDVRALMWFILGAVSNYPNSIKNRDIAAQILTAPQVAQATKMANECRQRNFKGCDAYANGTPLTLKMKRDFAKHEVPSCLAKQRRDPRNGHMSESQLNEYCNCTMARASDLIVVEDFRYAIQIESYENFRPIVEAAGRYCIERIKK